MNIIIDAFAVIGFLSVCFCVLFMTMGWWENRQLKQAGDFDDDFEPLPRQLKPHVPEQWKFTDDALRDPTPHPNDPAS